MADEWCAEPRGVVAPPAEREEGAGAEAEAEAAAAVAEKATAIASMASRWLVGGAPRWVSVLLREASRGVQSVGGS